MDEGPSRPPLYIIVNPVSGASEAPAFVSEHVVPLLNDLDISFTLRATKRAGDGARLGKQILREYQHLAGGDVTVVVAGGDGTVHELIEGVMEEDPDVNARVGFVILPFGTLSSLLAYLHPDIKSHPLPVTITSIPGVPRIPSVVVTSTALHAAILHTSEGLRASHPGVERFKIAAALNASVFFRADAKLINAQQYDPTTDTFVKPFTIATDEVQGPFGYFLSTTIADRLEDTFEISPVIRSKPPAPGTMDVVVLRPLRDPRVRAALASVSESDVSKAEETAGKIWMKRVAEILGAAYKHGEHVHMRYPKDAGAEHNELPASAEQGGEYVVEYFRCEGFEWIPTEPQHELSHLLCADGAIHVIPKGETATVRLARTSKESGFAVW